MKLNRSNYFHPYPIAIFKFYSWQLLIFSSHWWTELISSTKSCIFHRCWKSFDICIQNIWNLAEIWSCTLVYYIYVNFRIIHLMIWASCTLKNYKKFRRWAGIETWNTPPARGCAVQVLPERERVQGGRHYRWTDRERSGVTQPLLDRVLDTTSCVWG